MEIDGQVTISLKTFNQLQDRAKQADELKKENAGICKRRSQTLLIRLTNRKRNRSFMKLMIEI